MKILVKMGRFALLGVFALGTCAEVRAQVMGSTGTSTGGTTTTGVGTSISGGGVTTGGSTGGGSTGGGAYGNTGGGGQGGGSGNMGPVGSGLLGQNTGGAGRTGGTGGASGVPQTSNIFHSAFGNPAATAFSSGVAGTTMSTTTKAFGQPIYTLSTGGTGTGGYGGTYGGGGGGGVGGATTNHNVTAFNSVGMRRAPAYSTVLGPDLPLRKHAVSTVHAEVLRSLQGAAFLRDRNIQIGMDGGVIVLKGEVASDRERRLAEGVARLTPGVRELRNELVVPPVAAALPE